MFRLQRFTFWLILLSTIGAGAVLAAWENNDHAVVLEPTGGAEWYSSAPDGHGGMLVACHATGDVALSVCVSRLFCTGS